MYKKSFVFLTVLILAFSSVCCAKTENNNSTSKKTDLSSDQNKGTVTNMKAVILSSPQTVMSNPESKHNYFAWPSVTRTKDGRLMFGASGYRVRHVCPFGKCAVAFSDDEGKTWTSPQIAIDTPLDDRDVGLCAFGDSGIILTSFNNTRKVQQEYLKGYDDKELNAYVTAYLDTVTDDDEAKYCGNTTVVSHDNGKTFDKLFKAPVSSPHGPLMLDDDTVLWIGTIHDVMLGKYVIEAYTSDCKGGSQKFVSVLPQSEAGNTDYEPHAVLLPDGRIICHIRAERNEPKKFTLYQTVSDDNGKTWSKPVQLLTNTGGAPAHLLYTSDKKLISVYAKRTSPQKILAMVSLDGGESWQTDLELADCISSDCGYPSTVELKDGTFLTVYYAHDSADSPAVIKQVIWKLDD